VASQLLALKLVLLPREEQTMTIATNLHHATIRLLLNRKSARTSPGSHGDGFKIGLAIEGGAMRGVVSGGMVAALEMLGLRDCFDAVYGSSAGAIDGAYFIAGQATYGTTIFYENINNSQFINEWNFLIGGKPVLSLEYLLDYVCEEKKPLNWNAVLNSPLPLSAVASGILARSPVYLRGFGSKSDLKEALRASARVPVIAGPPVAYRDELLWDALIFEPIPVFAAQKDGCTHVIALLTRPRGREVKPVNFVDKWYIAPKIKKQYPEIYPYYIRRDKDYASIVRSCYSGSIGGEMKVLAIAPDSSAAEVRSRAKQRDKLVTGAISGAEAVFKAFGVAAHFVECLAPYSLEGAPLVARLESIHDEV
jgi:predicted patatin/cPLA2 family phospholipase